MSLRLRRQPVTNLLPALTTLQEYHKNYNQIVSFLELFSTDKQKQMDQAEQEMKHFVSRAENIVDDITKQLVQLEEKVNIRSVPSVHFKQNKSKTKPRKKNNNSIPETPVHKQNEFCMNNEEKKALKEQVLIARKICHYKFQQQAQRRLKKNPLINQIQLQFSILNEKKQNWRKTLVRYITYSFCSVCQTPIMGSRNHFFYIRHLKKYHPDVQTHRPSKNYSSQQIHQQMKRRMDKDNLILYKCNCTSELFPSQKQYIDHLLNEHNGMAPPFSSHNLSKTDDSVSLIENKEFNQDLVLEESLLPQFYYCGTCDFNFITCPSVYYDHMMRFHEGIIGEQSSHLLCDNLSIEENKCEIVKQPKIVPSQSRKKKVCIQIQPVQTSLTEDELTIMKIIHGYSGVYYCLSCQKSFFTYSQMRAHFEHLPRSVRHSHFQAKQKFLLVNFHLPGKASEPTNFRRYYLPLDLSKLSNEIKNLQLNVPLYSGGFRNLLRRQVMTYQSFINYIKNKLANPNEKYTKYYYSWVV